jgi:hypothetical protein
MEEWIKSEIDEEILRAENLYPGWPADPVHAAAVVAEEAGELVKAALDYSYGKDGGGPERDMRIEAIQTAAMAIRFLMGVGEYRRLAYPGGVTNNRDGGVE